MDDGIIDEEEINNRRILRTVYKKGIDFLHENKNEMRTIRSNAFDHFREQNNQNFPKVNHTREQQYDATIVKELSLVVKAQAANMNDASRRYDFPELANLIKRKFRQENSTHFSWEVLGKAAGAAFKTVPSVR
jgi:hypothetical protein